MPTVSQISNELDTLIKGWESDFKPLVTAVAVIRGIMSERIFGDSGDGENANGDKLPTKPYSTKPIYVSTDSLPSTPTSFQVGKRGKKIKSAYFPQGYSQLKSTLGRPALELTNALDSSFSNTPIVNNVSTVAIVIDDSQAGKVEGLEKKYGKIFIMSENEEAEFTLILQDLILEAVNKSIS